MHASEIFRWVITLVFGLFGLFVIIVNFRIVYMWLVRREHHSWIPLIGGFFALVGMAFCPLVAIRRFGFWPLFIDVGYCISLMTIGGFMQLYGSRVKRKKDGA